MKFAEVVQLLKNSNNDAFVLEGRRKDKQVLVCPNLAGRVMGTTYQGDEGQIGGFVNVEALKNGMNETWNNWGGEERHWLCPEGGQFGLMFGGKQNCFDNYAVPDGMNNAEYELIDQTLSRSSLTMKASLTLINAMDTKFDLECVRRITALDGCPYLTEVDPEVDFVGFESESTATNIGSKAWIRQTGCLAHWHLGQFSAGPRVIVIIPFRQGDLADPPVCEDYFRDFCIGGQMAPERLWIKDSFVLSKADGKYQTKIGQQRSRAMGLLASYNLDSNEMILIDYDYYPNLEYAASYWYEQTDPFNGDCASFFCEGPEARGEPDGRFYELESMSPAMLLSPGQSFTFRTRTIHIKGPGKLMAALCRRQLGPDLAILEAFDKQSVALYKTS